MMIVYQISLLVQKALFCQHRGQGPEPVLAFSSCTLSGVFVPQYHGVADLKVIPTLRRPQSKYCAVISQVRPQTAGINIGIFTIVPRLGHGA